VLSTAVMLSAVHELEYLQEAGSAFTAQVLMFMIALLETIILQNSVVV